MKNGRSFDLALFFAALADETRLRLLNLMSGGEVCVCFFADTLATNNPKVSRHLAYLKRAGLVKARRDGKWVHYRISPPDDKDAAAIFEATLEMLAKNKDMMRDREEMAKVCCAPERMVNIGRAIDRTAVEE